MLPSSPATKLGENRRLDRCLSRCRDVRPRNRPVGVDVASGIEKWKTGKDPMTDSYFDVAQICENGHVANSMARDYPNSNQDHCDKCGTPTIIACPSCQTYIRGVYHVPGAFGFDDFDAPAFCYKCGKSFPWTAARLRAAEDLADELESLTRDEQDALKKSLHDLVRDTPRTPIAETRFKRIMRKAGKEGYDGMRSLLTDVVSEVVRKSIFGGP